jgi:low molecular weight protein-tyrosine phosphatase
MKVLFICTANVCRSPLAEGYLKHLLKTNPVDGVTVESAGIMALTGSSAFECAADVAHAIGFDLSSHRARKLTVAMGEEADLILCMETWQAKEVLKVDPNWIAKVALLGNYHSSKNRLFQIPDPASFTTEHTMDVFKLIRDAVDRLHSELGTQHSAL